MAASKVFQFVHGYLSRMAMANDGEYYNVYFVVVYPLLVHCVLQYLSLSAACITMAIFGALVSLAADRVALWSIESDRASGWQMPGMTAAASLRTTTRNSSVAHAEAAATFTAPASKGSHQFQRHAGKEGLVLSLMCIRSIIIIVYSV